MKKILKTIAWIFLVIVAFEASTLHRWENGFVGMSPEVYGQHKHFVSWSIVTPRIVSHYVYKILPEREPQALKGGSWKGEDLRGDDRTVWLDSLWKYFTGKDPYLLMNNGLWFTPMMEVKTDHKAEEITDRDRRMYEMEEKHEAYLREERRKAFEPVPSPSPTPTPETIPIKTKGFVTVKA
jgi:hypothetical protein